MAAPQNSSNILQYTAADQLRWENFARATAAFNNGTGPHPGISPPGYKSCFMLRNGLAQLPRGYVGQVQGVAPEQASTAANSAVFTGSALGVLFDAQRRLMREVAATKASRPTSVASRYPGSFDMRPFSVRGSYAGMGMGRGGRGRGGSARGVAPYTGGRGGFDGARGTGGKAPYGAGSRGLDGSVPHRGKTTRGKRGGRKNKGRGGKEKAVPMEQTSGGADGKEKSPETKSKKDRDAEEGARLDAELDAFLKEDSPPLSDEADLFGDDVKMEDEPEKIHHGWDDNLDGDDGLGMMMTVGA
ncbi:hypothetical protein MKEN_00465400 [Mycena kentingensis (nom. inval.)]|nr:hypothetical protein MKEN_00465400 [Mycena kentingensis (nom. inval.)]